ncbi:MAG TPA: ABC transporter ATP-binding protein [Bryobacteraceae bacterium]|jgi:ABC-2 type transport system ATP-binding protein|nr:ABC transporter ATP-binding protein [Bryobacteraceae bacterium]
MIRDYVIEVHELTKRYGSFEAVRNITFQVAAGSVTGFLGRNGAGKSTTIKMLLGMIAPTSGTGTVLGASIDVAAESLEIRRRVAFVGEDKGLYGYMTVQQLIRFTRSFYSDWQPATEARLLRQYALPLNRKVKALSKGMRTKLALLLALARKPTLLILDEPTEGLDPVSIEELLQSLSGSTAEGTTVFFSSHQLSEVERIADEILILDHGNLAMSFSMDQLRENYRWVSAGFDKQPPSSEFQIPGVEHSRTNGRQVIALVKGDADRVARHAKQLGAVSIDIAPATLREVFLDRVRDKS